MSQTDMNVANASGAVVRADINAHLDAIITNSSGATEPTTKFANQWWADTSANILKRRNNTNTAWISIMDLTTGLIIGTDVAALTGVNAIEEFIAIAVSDETSDLETGTAKATFRMPYAFTLTDVRMGLTTAGTGGTLMTVDINESGSTILSTKLTTDASEKTSTTATTPAVISDTSLADDAEITIDIDAIGSTIAGAGLKVMLIGHKT